MINSTALIFTPDEVEDPVCIVPGHEHITAMIEDKVRFLALHNRLHETGMQDSDLHDATVIAIVGTEHDLDRAWTGPWN
jgi:hypothetical protein